MRISDLDPFEPIHSTKEPGATLLAIGWLERGHPFPCGTVTPEFFRKLVRLLQDPWQPAVAGGFHRCSLCQFGGSAGLFTHDEVSVVMGSSNAFVPGENVVYVVPSLVLHYIDAHQYGPPEVFQHAVMACPEMRSIAYLRLIARLGLSRIR